MKDTDTINSLKGAVDHLIKALELEQKDRKKLSLLNRNLALKLGIGGIILSSLATIFGILANFDDRIPYADVWMVLTPVSASLAATLQSALLGYPVDKRAVFHRTLGAEAGSMKTDLTVRQLLGTADPNYIQEISDQLKELQIKGASEEPETNDKITALTLKQIDETLEQINQIKTQLNDLS